MDWEADPADGVLTASDPSHICVGTTSYPRPVGPGQVGSWSSMFGPTKILSWMTMGISSPTVLNEVR